MLSVVRAAVGGGVHGGVGEGNCGCGRTSHMCDLKWKMTGYLIIFLFYDPTKPHIKPKLGVIKSSWVFIGVHIELWIFFATSSDRTFRYVAIFF